MVGEKWIRSVIDKKSDFKLSVLKSVLNKNREDLLRVGLKKGIDSLYAEHETKCSSFKQ